MFSFSVQSLVMYYEGVYTEAALVEYSLLY